MSDTYKANDRYILNVKIYSKENNRYHVAKYTHNAISKDVDGQ